MKSNNGVWLRYGGTTVPFVHVRVIAYTSGVDEMTVQHVDGEM